MERINLLVTLDEAYLPPLRAMLKSLFINNPREQFRVYLIHSDIPQGELEALDKYCMQNGAMLYPIKAPEQLFGDAPTSRRLTKAMHYRLLAHKLLPDDIERILYLDPDVLVINPIREMYETDMKGYLYAACIHTDVSGITGTVNKIRLSTYETAGYFNSGVLLMNMAAQREAVHEQDIYKYIDAHKLGLILPDQDILNGLYGDRIRPLDDSLYNYDAHRYEVYRMASSGEKDVDWVMANTVILHFCGKNKPWLKPNRSRFGILYKHYSALAEHTMTEIARPAPGQTAAS